MEFRGQYSFFSASHHLLQFHLYLFHILFSQLIAELVSVF